MKTNAIEKDIELVGENNFYLENFRSWANMYFDVSWALFEKKSNIYQLYVWSSNRL